MSSTTFRTKAPDPILTNRTDLGATGISRLLGMLSDRQTLIAVSSANSQRQVCVSTDGATWTGGLVLGASGDLLDGFMETNDGEIIFCTKQAGANGAAGKLIKTTGWNRATGTATSLTTVLTASGVGVNFDGRWVTTQRAVAPAWSDMAGSILIMEYGTKPAEAVAAGRATSTAAVHAYLSRNNGATWTTVFDLRDYFTGDLLVHGHGCAVSVTDKGWYLNGGDGGLGDAGTSWVRFCPDEIIDTAPVWTMLPGAETASGVNQVTALGDYGTGLIGLSDALAARAVRWARKGFRRIGAQTSVATVAPGGLVGSNLHQNADQPGAPIFGTHSSSTVSGPPTILTSLDGGESWQEAYREAAPITGGNGYSVVVGPTINGKVFANYNGTGSSTVLSFDLAKPAAAGGLDTSRQILTGPGITGGGDLSADRTLSLASAYAAGRRGLIAHAFQSGDAGSTSAAFTSGQLRRVKVVAEDNASSATRTVRLQQVAAGTGVTLAKVAVFDTAGNQLGVSADQSANWSAATTRNVPVGTFALVKGTEYLLEILVVGTTGPQFARSGNNGAGNAGLSGAGLLWASDGTGLSDMPTTITPSSGSSHAEALWAGLY